MKPFTLLSFILFQVFTTLGQPTTDSIKTNKGQLIVQPIQHATFVMAWNNKTIFVDPTGGSEAFQSFSKPDIILITDIHGDHFDVKTLEALNAPRAKVVVPQAVADLLPKSLRERAVVIGNGQKAKLKGFSVLAVPMYNVPETPDSRHPKGRGNGYILKLGNKKIYISGDTEDILEMRGLDDIDIAFVCMNLPYTMDVEQAASGVLAFKPKIVYPYHYRGSGGLSDVEKFKSLVESASKKVEVRILKWY